MNIYKHTLTYAAGAAIVGIALSITLHLLGQVMSPWNYLSYAGYIGFVVLGLIDWRTKFQGGYLTYGKAFGYATWQAVFYAVIIAIWTYVFMVYIAPEEVVKFQNHQLAETAEKLREYKFSEVQIENQIEMSRKFMTPGFAAIFGVLGNLLFLSIANLIIAAIVKKDKPQDNSFAQ